jgi:hypothetical protein
MPVICYLAMSGATRAVAFGAMMLAPEPFLHS